MDKIEYTTGYMIDNLPMDLGTLTINGTYITDMSVEDLKKYTIDLLSSAEIRDKDFYKNIIRAILELKAGYEYIGYSEKDGDYMSKLVYEF